MKIVTIMILLVTTIIIYCSDNSNKTSLENGIIFSNGKLIRPIEKYKTIEYIIKMEKYFENTFKLGKCAETIENLCSLLRDNKNCKYFLRDIHENIQRINDDHNSIRSFDENHRNKREIRNINAIILTIFDWIFGSPTINEWVIHEIQNATMENRQMIHTSTQIMNETIIVTTQLNNDIESDLNTVYDELNKLKDNAMQFEINHKLSAYIQMTHSIIINHNLMTNTIIDILRNIKDVNIARIIKYDQLREDILLMEEMMGNDTKLPINTMQQSIYQLIKASNFESSINREELRITLKIPIVSHDTFRIIQPKIFPIKRNNSFFILDSDNTEFIYNPRTGKVAPLSMEVTQNCIQLFDKSLICPHENITFFSPTNCLETIYTQSNNSNQICKFRQIKPQNYIFKMNDNTIFYLTINHIEIIENCPGENTHKYEIFGRGFLKFAGGCFIQAEENEFYIPHNDIKKTSEINPWNNNTSFDFNYKYNINENLPLKNKIRFLDGNTKLGGIMKQIEELASFSNRKIEKIHIPRTTTLSIPIILIIIICLFCCFKRVWGHN